MIFAVIPTASCRDATAPLGQLESGTLVVRVVWDGQGVADKRVEVLELQRTGRSDAAGYATFEPPAGEYTLRAYDIEVLDCLPCV